MPYWHRPKFWLILVSLQIPAFLLAAIITTTIALLCIAIHITSDHASFAPFDALGILLNIFFAYEAFRFTRNLVKRWPEPHQPPGFPIIINPSQPPK